LLVCTFNSAIVSSPGEVNIPLLLPMSVFSTPSSDTPLYFGRWPFTANPRALLKLNPPSSPIVRDAPGIN
jgi:hypothetical protein